MYTELKNVFHLQFVVDYKMYLIYTQLKKCFSPYRYAYAMEKKNKKKIDLF